MESADSPSAVRRFVVVTLALPMLITSAALFAQAAWLSELPNPVAIHWGANGEPDGFGQAWTFPTVNAALGLGLPLLVAATTLPMLRRGARGDTFRFMGGLALGMSTFIAVLNTWSVYSQRGVESATEARLGGAAIVFPLALGAAAGIVGWLLQPRQHAQVPDWEPSGSMDLAPGERAVWMRTAVMTRWGAIALIAAGTMMAGAAIAEWIAGEIANAWLLLGTLAMVGLAAAAATVFHVRVDDDGLTAVAALGFPRLRVALDDVAEAGVAPVNGFAEFGGWGLRMRPGATGIVLRNGDALQVTRKGGRRLVITVDDAESAAALLMTLARRSASGRGV